MQNDCNLTMINTMKKKKIIEPDEVTIRVEDPGDSAILLKRKRQYSTTKSTNTERDKTILPGTAANSKPCIDSRGIYALFCRC